MTNFPKHASNRVKQALFAKRGDIRRIRLADTRHAAKAHDCRPARLSSANERNTTEGGAATVLTTSNAAISAPKRERRRRNASPDARLGRREHEPIRSRGNAIQSFDASIESSSTDATPADASP
ncbi:MAG: hypothetical protein ACTHJO_15305 [Rhodanobacter sp.]